VLAHIHDFTFNDLLKARNGGGAAVTAKLTVEGVAWTSDDRCFLDYLRFPGAILAACLQLPGGWRNRFLYYLNQVTDTATLHPYEVMLVRNANDNARR
jgi:hypothetical protein